jgi:hypothetical protein
LGHLSIFFVLENPSTFSVAAECPTPSPGGAVAALCLPGRRGRVLRAGVNLGLIIHFIVPWMGAATTRIEPFVSTDVSTGG